jgi:hypothetical protein
MAFLGYSVDDLALCSQSIIMVYGEDGCCHIIVPIFRNYLNTATKILPVSITSYLAFHLQQVVFLFLLCFTWTSNMQNACTLLRK